MASSAPLADIKERFFCCSVCYDPFKDPKLLPCLHRYCRHCLEGIIAADTKDSFHCPLCQQKHKIPKEGVDGFKNDFHIKSVVEFLRLQTSFEQDDVKICYGCKKTKQVVAYCFKCKNFLCDHCYKFHLNNDMIAEHRPHTLNLKTVDLKSLTLEKLASLTEDPRCTTHVKHLAQLCCETCGNLPICVACTYSGHKGHNIQDVKALAPSERKKLKAILSELENYKDKLYELPKRVGSARQKLKANVKENLEKAESQYKSASDKVARKIEDNMIKLEQSKQEIMNRKEEDCNQVKLECEEEMEKVKQRHDSILKDREQKYDKDIVQVEDKYGGISNKLFARLERFEGELKSFKEELEANQVQNEKGFQGISDHSEHTINRYENFTATSSTVLASNNEWTDAQCLPPICAASEPLLKDVKKEFKELDSMSHTKMSDSMFLDKVTITEQEAVVTIKEIKDKEWLVYGITSSRDGHIIITGMTSGKKHSHITGINIKGEIIQQIQIPRVAGSTYLPYRYCESLSQSLIATVCQTNQVGIYDVCNGKYIKKDIKDINISWHGKMTCVAVDTVNNYIYVGGIGRDVLVFDDQLNCCGTVHDSKLLVCDCDNSRALAVTMEGQVARLVYEFTKPGLCEENWQPKKVCTDSNNFIYMLWRESVQHILTQYSQDGHRLLTTRRVDDYANCITTVKTDDDEKLLIATWKLGKLYTYGLEIL